MFLRYCYSCDKHVSDNNFRKGRRKCLDCEKSRDNKHKQEIRKDPEVLEKHKQSTRKSYHKNKNNRKQVVRDPRENKNAVLLWNYGLTIEQYEQILSEQSGLCKICNKEETRKSRFGGICKLHVDHDHKTGKVRGLLCHTCNLGLGLFYDDVQILQKAISYLDGIKEKHHGCNI